MKLSRAKIILMTLFMSAVVLWITSPSEKRLAPAPLKQNLNQEYSWQTANTTIWKITPNSTEQQTVIKAEQVNYSDEQNLSTYQQPNIKLFKGETVNQLVSESGQSINDTELIFEHNVKVTQTKLNAISQLQTQRLVYNTDSQMMHSEHDVEINFKDTRITGTGFQANLDKEEFSILSNVVSSIQQK